jgi:multicomponent K+:H+ antiporter subunit G
MTDAVELPAWAALLTSLFVLLGAALTLIGSLGLLRLGNFYERVHAPTLGATLGTGGVLVASIICFSALQSRPVVHEVLITVFVTVTTPVTLILLVRAALYRDNAAGGNLSPLGEPSHRKKG